MAGDTQPESRSDKSKIIFVGVVIIVIAIVVYILVTEGQTGLMNLGSKVLQYAIIAGIIGLIIWVVLKILQKPKVDLVALDMQNIIDAGTLSKPPMLKDLYFTGDKEHGEFRVGNITGYCQLQSYKDLNKIANLTDEEIVELQKKGQVPSDFIIKEDCFVFKKFGFPFSLFEAPKVLRTLEDEHSQLVGDVKVYAVSMIKKYSYYWPNRGHLDVARIDHAVIGEAYRGSIHQFLKDFVSIQQKAVGLDAEHRKGLEQRKLLKIPSPLSEQEGRGG
jgi:hypothetical protein